MKRAKKNLAFIEAALIDGRGSHAEAMTLSLIEITITRGKMDKAMYDLVELKIMAQGPVYQQVFDSGWNGDHYLRWPSCAQAYIMKVGSPV